MTEKNVRNSPKLRAWSRVIFPAGIGLFEVRVIMESMSESHHIFRAPAAPAPIPMQINEPIATTGFIEVGAITSATPAVKTANLITLNFKRAM